MPPDEWNKGRIPAYLMILLYEIMLSLPRDDRHWDHDGPPQHNQGHPQYVGYACSANNSLPTARAVNVEEPRVKDYHNRADDCELEGGGGDMVFNPNGYEGIEESPSGASTSSLLPPHVKAAQIAYHYK